MKREQQSTAQSWHVRGNGKSLFLKELTVALQQAGSSDVAVCARFAETAETSHCKQESAVAEHRPIMRSGAD
jgi:hypothetical protein